MRARSRFTGHFTSCLTAVSILLFLIQFSQISSAQDSPGNICETKTTKRNISIPFLSNSTETQECFSTQPINWISNEISKFPKIEASAMEPPFGIETKLVPCGSGQKQTPGFKQTIENSSTIQHYFTSRLIFNKDKYISSGLGVNVHIYCGTFTPHPNSTKFPGFKISTEAQNFIQKIPKPRSPRTASSDIRECEETELILYQNVSSGNCSCESAELFHCDNLMECRFLAHWKYPKACKAIGFQNKCNVTSFSLPDSSTAKGGILFCGSTQQDRRPYILFFPVADQPEPNEIISMTTNQTESNLTQIQILGNDNEDYKQFLKLSTVRPQNEREITWKSGAQIECRGSAFLFLDRIFWNVTIENGDSESNVLPNFNISDERIGNSTEGEKYVSSTLTILADNRNTSSVLNVTCQAALSDGGVFVQSNIPIKLEVYKPQITGNFSCVGTSAVQFNCEAESGADVTWRYENGSEPTRKPFPDCQNETIICTATLQNGVQNSYQFMKDDCDKFVEMNKKDCSEILEKRRLAKTTTTTTTPPAPTNNTTNTTTPKISNSSPTMLRQNLILLILSSFHIYYN